MSADASVTEHSDYQSLWANKYRGATVEDLEPPPALSCHPTDPISHALMSGLERDYTHLTVTSENRALLGYISIPRLQELLKEGKVKDSDPVQAAMQKFRRKGTKYKVITLETPLEELEEFFKGGVDGSGKQEFAVVTDGSRKFVLGVATREDLEGFPADSAGGGEDDGDGVPKPRDVISKASAESALRASDSESLPASPTHTTTTTERARSHAHLRPHGARARGERAHARPLSYHCNAPARPVLRRPAPPRLLPLPRRLPPVPAWPSLLHPPAATARLYARPAQEPRAGTTTPVPEGATPPVSTPPFYFEAGYALYHKRPSRPFPPPFLSLPSTSFSEPLSTHHKSRDRRPKVNGEMIRGVTNGDDAVLVSDYFIGANDGVGAWATKEKGHAALWSRLILHFWAREAEHASYDPQHEPDPVAYLEKAFEQTQQATSEPNQWYGTTTACAALLSADAHSPSHPVLYVTQLGDSQILVIRPRNKQIVFKTTEQWHWFDCPRQLGTNSPDTPKQNAVMDRIEIEEDDIVIAMTDGVIDNLWEHEVVDNVVGSMYKWLHQKSPADRDREPAEQSYADGMRFVARELVNAARTIAEDPFAESPYMEKAIDEGLSIEGGKLDDISVVAAQCKRRKG